MTAFTYRMGAGSPGDVTRAHPASIRPFLNDATGSNPSTYFGQALLFHGATNTVRAVDHTDDSAKGGTTVAIAGISVRAYPTQDSGSGETFGAAAYGAGGPTPSSVVDTLTQGSILVQQNVPGGTYASGSLAGYQVLGGPVYVRVTAGTIAGWTTSMPVGGFEVYPDVTTSANQMTVANAYWNGPPDSFGVAEIILID